MKVLIVDDEEIMRVTLENALRDAGYATSTCANAESALHLLRRDPVDVAVVDLKMPGMDGMAFIEIVRREMPHTVIIMMTAYGTVQTAVEAMKKGAYDYLTKPFDTYELELQLQRLQQHHALVEENQSLRSKLQERHGFHQIAGASAAMQQVYDALDIVCNCDCTVLIEGETGTGKEMVTNAIHYNSARRNSPLVKVSCAALSAEILESELFGHVRGAFTGATADKVGRFELADQGTLFLDEVDDIPLGLQVKLLRVLEEGTYERVGSTTVHTSHARVLAATKVDLRQHIAASLFRDDLFYRLNQVPIKLPALRDHREDIPLLIEIFLRGKQPKPELADAALVALMDYAWPGNVRELKHVIDRLSLFHPQRIELTHLPQEIVQPNDLLPSQQDEYSSYSDIMNSTEIQLLQRALHNSGGNQREAARLLQIPPSTLRSRLEHHNLL